MVRLLKLVESNTLGYGESRYVRNLERIGVAVTTMIASPCGRQE